MHYNFRLCHILQDAVLLCQTLNQTRTTKKLWIHLVRSDLCCKHTFSFSAGSVLDRHYYLLTCCSVRHSHTLLYMGFFALFWFSSVLTHSLQLLQHLKSLINVLIHKHCLVVVIVNFPLDEDPDVSMIAWTTTPWTLPSNLALVVNPDKDYVKVKGICQIAGQHVTSSQSKIRNCMSFVVSSCIRYKALLELDNLQSFSSTRSWFCNRAFLNFQAFASHDIKMAAQESCRIDQKMTYLLTFC